ncbi:MAG: hypothetical protein ACTS6G_04105 [Candidatus Hodgkinia cicadicola]
MKTNLTNTLVEIFNTSLLTKCANNLMLCWIERYVRQTLEERWVALSDPKLNGKSQNVDVINSILQIGKLSSKRPLEVIKYELDWAKVVKGDNIIIGAIDVISTCSWVEGFEFEVMSEMVIVRILTNKGKLATANVRFRAIQNHKNEQVIIFDRELNRIGLINDACRFEATISKTEFLKIKTTNVLRIEVLNLLRNDVIAVEFETQKMIKALTTQLARETTNKALSEQSFLQRNLLFNLNYKTKEYLRCPNVTQDLEKQFGTMKLRLTNEVNDPRLLRLGYPKWKSYV